MEDKEKNKVPPNMINRIIDGDSEQILKLIPKNSIDIILTSPPYNFGIPYKNYNDKTNWTSYFNKLFAILDECIRVLKLGGRAIINIQPNFVAHTPTHHMITNHLIKRKLIWRDEIIWEKNNYNCSTTAWGSWKSPSCPRLKYTHEFLEVFSKGSTKKEGDKKNIDITAEEFKKLTKAKWIIPAQKKNPKYKHPAMFPEKLVEAILKIYSFKKDTVLDPFNGAGTTTGVASKLGRKFIGIDISKQYNEIARRRILPLYTIL